MSTNNLRILIFKRAIRLFYFFILVAFGVASLFAFKHHDITAKKYYSDRVAHMVHEVEAYQLIKDHDKLKSTLTSEVDSFENASYAFIEKDNQVFIHSYSGEFPFNRDVVDFKKGEPFVSTQDTDGSFYFDFRNSSPDGSYTVHLGIKKIVLLKELLPYIFVVLAMGLMFALWAYKIAKQFSIWITEAVDRLNHELKIAERKQLQSAKLASLGEMAGGIAHEINNPLTIISGSAQFIEKIVNKDGEVDRERLKKLTANITDTVTRITKIIKGLRTISHDTGDEDFGIYNLKECIEEVTNLTLEKFRANGVEFSLSILDGIEKEKIEIKRAQFFQVLLNMIGNSYDAVKTLDEKWIKIEVSADDDSFIMSFTDSGAGINEEVRERIFEPFYSTKSIGEGTGLGLSLSNSIIQEHHGKLYIDEKDPNTCFVIVLPKSQIRLKSA